MTMPIAFAIVSPRLENESLMWTVFAATMVSFLVIDLGWLNRKVHVISIASAARQSLFWITMAGLYGALMWRLLSPSMAADFYSAYLTEKMLSTDNLFVIMLLFTFFKIEDKYHHEVLFYGILGAVILRGSFIGGGAFIVQKFHWVLYPLGAFLAYSGFKLLFGGDDDGKDFSKSRILRWCDKHLPLTLEDHKGRFFIHDTNGKSFLGRQFTMLFVTLIMVETTDVIFAVDSIPAVLTITPDPFVAFTSNIFAVMGLRSLYFLVEGIMKKFHLLQKGVSFVLMFIGGKMLLDIVGIHISSVVSFLVIVGCLTIALLASLIIPAPQGETKKVAAA